MAKKSEENIRKRNTTSKTVKESINEDEKTSSSATEATSSPLTTAEKPSQSSSTTTNEDISSFYPSPRFIFRILLIIRLFSAVFNQVWDCDETYNYWEPLHFSLYKYGFQTWEYAPQYALRSYLYIYLHAIFLFPLKYLNMSKQVLFFMLRALFALLATYTEVKLYSLVVKRYNSTIACYLAFILLSNVGLFISTTSFLPSTFVLYFVSLAYATWMNKSYITAIASIAFATLLGWPFVALLGVPIAIDLLFIEKKIFYFIKYSVFFGLIISGIQIAFDSFLFGKFVFAPWNIIKYNVFPQSKEQGPNLYGEEPLSFYLINCLLNFNVLFPLAIASLALQLIHFKLKLSSTLNKHHLLISFALYLWFAVFFTRPHKEERFLFPVYTIICILGAHSLYLFTDITEYLFRKIKIIKKIVQLLPILVLTLHIIFSVLRFLALYKNYSSQIMVFQLLNNPQIKHYKKIESKLDVNVCMGKEWYRYPSSFFLPEGETNNSKQKWRLKFIKSNFGGQLPNEYLETKTGDVLKSFRDVNLKKFNDRNAEIKERYVSLDKCDFVIDTFSRYSYKNKTSEFNDKNKWHLMLQLKFININKSKSLYRAIYIPYLYENHTQFLDYNLYRRA